MFEYVKMVKLRRRNNVFHSHLFKKKNKTKFDGNALYTLSSALLALGSVGLKINHAPTDDALIQ